MSRKLHSISVRALQLRRRSPQNIESLLIEPILRPIKSCDSPVRAFHFVIDTRERCERRLAGTIYGEDETIRGGEVCRYNQTDATRGHFFNADFRRGARARSAATLPSRVSSRAITRTTNRARPGTRSLPPT
jgi:hypothetical protein